MICRAQAQATQEANRAASNRWQPLWAIGAMLVLGADEFLAVLYNPLWLVLALLVFLFIKSVYQVKVCCVTGVVQGSRYRIQGFTSVISSTQRDACMQVARQLRVGLSLTSCMPSAASVNPRCCLVCLGLLRAFRTCSNTHACACPCPALASPAPPEAAANAGWPVQDAALMLLTVDQPHLK